MINRTQQPDLHPITAIDFVKPKVFDLTPNTKLFCMTEVPNETAKFELYFDAGTFHGKTELASLVNSLVLSGTKSKTSIEIHGELDAAGAFFEQGVSNENAVLSVYALRENILPIARILKEAVENCQFPEHEVEQSIAERRQKLKVNLEKVSVLAQRALKQRLFHSDERYSAIPQDDSYNDISLIDIKEFHNEYYLNGLSRLVLVGDFSQDEIDSFMDIFGGWCTSKNPEFSQSFENIKGQSHLDKTGAVQSAIRIGRPLFNKTHEDYLDFQILQTILGDYFGSRLMSNIREDKGYTYGIGCHVGEFKETGYFIIATEVGKDVREAALNEIKFEMERLQSELVSEDELNLVKNYMLGQLLKSADGPYSMTDLFVSVEMVHMDLSFYNKAIESIRAITPERLQALALKYFNWDDYSIISAG